MTEASNIKTRAGMVMIDGIVRCGRNRSTPPATEIPVVVTGAH